MNHCRENIESDARVDAQIEKVLSTAQILYGKLDRALNGSPYATSMW